MSTLISQFKKKEWALDAFPYARNHMLSLGLTDEQFLQMDPNLIVAIDLSMEFPHLSLQDAAIKRQARLQGEMELSRMQMKQALQDSLHRLSSNFCRVAAVEMVLMAMLTGWNMHLNGSASPWWIIGWATVFAISAHFKNKFETE